MPDRTAATLPTQRVPDRVRSALGRFVRFGLVGVVNTGTYFAAYLLLRLVVPYLLAHVVATAISLTGSYFMNCRLTFHVRPSWRTFLLFPLTNLANVTVTTLGLPIAVHGFGIDERIAPLPVQLTAIPVTYLVAHTIMTGRFHGPTRDEVFGASRA